MDDRWANIDLVFRNGLKDFEALPPEDVWENVRPAAAKKHSFILLKAAATFAGLITIGLSAYVLGRKTALSGEAVMAGFTPATTLNIDQPSVITPSSVISDLKETSSLTPAVAFNTSTTSEASVIEQVPAEAVSDADNTPSFGGNTTALKQEPVLSFPEKLDDVITGNNKKMALDIPAFETEKVKPDERWSVAALASPTFYSKTGSGNKGLVRDMISSEHSVSSVSGGVTVSYNLSRRVSIQTGLYYASHGQQVGGVNSYSGFQRYSPAKGTSSFTVNTSDGPVFSKNADVFFSGSDKRIQTAYTSDVFDPDKANLVPIDNSIIQRFGYIQMPIMVKYKFFDRTLDLNLSGGISYDFLIGNSAFIKNGDQKYDLGETEGLNNSVFSSSIGMGMEYNISRKMSFNVEPTFRYFLNPFNDAAGTWIHPYSFGIFSGFSYRF